MTHDGPDSDELTIALNRALLDNDQELGPGSVIGNFVIERQLGEGGMGTVWLADQIEPVRRRVAIKLTRRRRITGPERELFMLERQALARINHPAVGQIYEAGALDDGTPYFVMEYVQGSTIASYCDNEQLSLNERIELMRKVCLGIEHTHQKGVLHCDLKPSNIVVTKVDGLAQPKIIDFGLARVLDRAQSSTSLFGTLAYLAPEQADSSASLDTRTDVYTLGIILFEVLSGQRLRKTVPTDGDFSLDTLRSILEKAPSINLPPDLAGKRLSARRRRELEAIIQCATQSDPEARYSGAAALAGDLAGWLAQEPVSAMASTTGYRWHCLLRRHRLPFSVAGLALLSLIGGLIGTSLGLREAKEQRSIAEQRQEDLAEVVRFQQTTLSDIDMQDLAERLTHRLASNAASLAIRQGQAETSAELRAEQTREMIQQLAPVDAARDLVVNGILGQADALIAERHGDNPAIEAALRVSLGQTLLAWQDFDSAETQIQKARAYYAEAGDRTSRDALQAETEAVKLHWWQRRFSEGYELAMAIRPIAESALGASDDLSLYLLRAEASLSSYVEGPQVAVSKGRILVDRLKRLRGPEHPDTLRAEGDLLYNRINGSSSLRCDEALIDDFHDHLERAANLSGGNRRTLAVSSMNLGTCLQQNGQHDQAQSRLADAADVGRSVLGEQHSITMLALNDRAYSLLLLDRIDDTESVVNSLYEQQLAIHGEDSQELLRPRSYRFYLAGANGRFSEAIDGLTALIGEVEVSQAPDDSLLSWLYLIRSRTHERAGDVEQARADAEEARTYCQVATAATTTAESCLLQDLEAIRLAAVGGSPPEAGLLNERLVLARNLHRYHPARSLAAWLVYRYGDSETPADRLRNEELDWLLEAEPKTLSLAQQRIAADLRR